MKALSFILVVTLFSITTANAQITKGNYNTNLTRNIHKTSDYFINTQNTD